MGLHKALALAYNVNRLRGIVYRNITQKVPNYVERPFIVSQIVIEIIREQNSGTAVLSTNRKHMGFFPCKFALKLFLYSNEVLKAWIYVILYKAFYKNSK